MILKAVIEPVSALTWHNSYHFSSFNQFGHNCWEDSLSHKEFLSSDSVAYLYDIVLSWLELTWSYLLCCRDMNIHILFLRRRESYISLFPLERTNRGERNLFLNLSLYSIYMNSNKVYTIPFFIAWTLAFYLLQISKTHPVNYRERTRQVQSTGLEMQAHRTLASFPSLPHSHLPHPSCHCPSPPCSPAHRLLSFPIQNIGACFSLCLVSCSCPFHGCRVIIFRLCLNVASRGGLSVHPGPAAPLLF